MTAEIIEFPGAWHGRLSFKKVIKAAKKHNLKEMVIIGMDENETTHVISSSNSNPEVLWLIKQGELRVLAVPSIEDDPDDITA